MRRAIQRLTFVTDAPHFGGAERYIVAMARAAQRRGMAAGIYWTPTESSNQRVFDEARACGLDVTMVPPERTRTLGGVIREFRAMLDHQRPDALVINGCGRPRFWVIPWLAWWAGMPAVWVHQMVDSRDHRRLRPRWLGGRIEGVHAWRLPQMLRHRLAAEAASAVVTLNAQDRERVVRWHGVRRERIRVVPHGVDGQWFRFDLPGRNRLRQAWGITPDADAPPYVVGTAGRLVAGKGVERLIEATALLVKRGYLIMAVVAGDGDQRAAMAQLAKRLDLADAVRFVGMVDDMPAFHSALDVFVLCSETESFGLALAEAMACERAVIGTPTAGAMRQIEHGHNGWQLGTHGAGELADALETLFRDAPAREAMGRQGRSDVMLQFSIDLTLERTLRALRGSARERSPLLWPGMNEAAFAGMTAEDLA